VKNVVLLFLIFLLPVFFPAQNKSIDSLQKLLRQPQEDTSRLKTMYNLATQYNSDQADSAHKLYNRIALFAKDVLQKGQKNLSSTLAKKYEGMAYLRMGTLYYGKGEYNAALEAYLKSNSCFYEDSAYWSPAGAKEKLKRKEILASSLVGTGNVYADQGNQAKALETYLKALRLVEEVKNKRTRAGILCNIGIVYHQLGDDDAALEYYSKALKINEKEGYLDYQAVVFSNFSTVHVSHKRWEEAMKAALRSLEIYDKVGDQGGVAQQLSGVGMIHKYMGDAIAGKNRQREKDSLYEKARVYFSESLQMGEKLQDLLIIQINTGNLGSIYMARKKFREAEKCFYRALALSDTMGDVLGIREWELNLSYLYEDMGLPQKALIHYKKHIAARDSILNDETTRKTVQLQMQYDFDKKEAETRAEQDKKDAIGEEERQKQTIIRNAFITGFVLIFFLALFIFRGYRNKKKANLVISKQKEEVEKAKTLIEEQKKMVEEKQKEILDSIYYARRIQRALITNENYIHKSISRLKGT